MLSTGSVAGDALICAAVAIPVGIFIAKLCEWHNRWSIDREVRKAELDREKRIKS